jgi:hypothetical protein
MARIDAEQSELSALWESALEPQANNDASDKAKIEINGLMIASLRKPISKPFEA